MRTKHPGGVEGGVRRSGGGKIIGQWWLRRSLQQVATKIR